MTAWRRGSGVGAAVLLALANGSPPSLAQAAPDSASSPRVLERRDALYAAAPVAATLILARWDEDLTDALQRRTLQDQPLLRAGAGAFRLVGFPGTGAAAAGAYAVGRLPGRPALADAGLHMGESLVMASVVTGGLKLLVGRVRPRASPEDALVFEPGRGLTESDYRSYPSGHTALAFAAASAAASELRHWAPRSARSGPVLLYGAAALAGVSRIYHGGHWATDVLTGAAIGSWSGWKVVRLNHAYPGNRVDRLLLRDVVLFPVHDGMAVLVSLPH